MAPKKPKQEPPSRTESGSGDAPGDEARSPSVKFPPLPWKVVAPVFTALIAVILYNFYDLKSNYKEMEAKKANSKDFERLEQDIRALEGFKGEVDLKLLARLEDDVDKLKDFRAKVDLKLLKKLEVDTNEFKRFRGLVDLKEANQRHRQVLLDLCETLGGDANLATSSCHMGGRTIDIEDLFDTQ